MRELEVGFDVMKMLGEGMGHGCDPGLLLAPESAGADHLKALARVSRLLRNQNTCEKLRAASRAEVLYALLTEPTNGGANSSSQAA